MATSIQVTFDCADPDALADFWAAALHYVKQPPPEGYASWEAFLAEHGMGDLIGTASAIVDPDRAGPRFYFQRVPESKTAKNRMHLDLNVPEVRRVGMEEGKRRIVAEVNRLEELGAVKVGTYEQHGETWTVMKDPEGNEFCVQ
jgi:catechol 2,3-dioxygenase-like lactoylglutathione lyase family enzyme